MWFQLWRYIFRSVELIFPLENVYFSGYIDGLMLGGKHWGMVSLFVHWDDVLKNGHEAQKFFICSKIFEVSCTLVPIRCNIFKNQASIIII